MHTLLASNARHKKALTAVLAVATFAFSAASGYVLMESTKNLSASVSPISRTTTIASVSAPKLVKTTTVAVRGTPVSGSVTTKHSSPIDEIVLESLYIEGPYGAINNWNPATVKAYGKYSDGTKQLVKATWSVESGEARLTGCALSKTCTVRVKSNSVTMKAEFMGKTATGQIRTKYVMRKPLADMPSYKDQIPEWAQENIGTIGRLGIMTGYESGEFKPEAQVTFAQMATMLYRAANTSSSAEVDATCLDAYEETLPKDHYAYDAFCYFGANNADISWAAKPDEPMTRRDVVHMLSSMFGEKYLWSSATKQWDTGDINLHEVPGITKISDIPEDNMFHRDLFFVLIEGIMTVQDEKFRPNDTLNRAEAATVALRTFEFLMKMQHD